MHSCITVLYCTACMIWVCSLLRSHGCSVFMHISGVLFFLLVPHDDTHHPGSHLRSHAN